MYEDKSIGVVIPAYNEEKLIGCTIESVPDFVDKIVVVDDCSSDSTAEILADHLAARRGKMVVLTHDVNQGVGGAIATGYKWCRDNDIAVAVVMAGDAQMDPKDMPALLEPVVSDEADYAKGNRLVSGEAYRIIPKTRYFGNAALSLLTKIASGYWHIADSQTGYTAINKRALHAINWDRMYKRYGQPNDLLVRLNVENMRVRDVPIRPVYNVGETSGIRISRAIGTIGFLLVRLFLWRLKEKYIVRDFHPLVFFYGLGGFMFLINILFFFRLVARWANVGHVPEITFLIWLFSFSTGLMCLFFAMLFDMEHTRMMQ